MLEFILGVGATLLVAVFFPGTFSKAVTVVHDFFTKWKNSDPE